jgi:hypothetical protein
LLVAAGLLLAACNAAVEDGITGTAVNDEITAQNGGDVSGFEGTPPADFGERELSEQALVMVGMFLLDETNFPISPEQAVELLPLWQVLLSMVESETAAVEEVNALMAQISATLNDEQFQALQAMSLTQQDQFDLMGELGLEIGFGRGGNLPEGRIPQGGFAGGGQGFPGGGPGGGGPGGGQDFQNISPDQIETLQAERQANDGAGFRLAFNPVLLEALIEMLQEKVNS